MMLPQLRTVIMLHPTLDQPLSFTKQYAIYRRKAPRAANIAPVVKNKKTVGVRMPLQPQQSIIERTHSFLKDLTPSSATPASVSTGPRARRHDSCHNRAEFGFPLKRQQTFNGSSVVSQCVHTNDPLSLYCSPVSPLVPPAPLAQPR